MQGGRDAGHTGRRPDTRAPKIDRTHEQKVMSDRRHAGDGGGPKTGAGAQTEQTAARARAAHPEPTRNELEMFGTCWFWYVHIARSGIGAKVS